MTSVFSVFSFESQENVNEEQLSGQWYIHCIKGCRNRVFLEYRLWSAFSGLLGVTELGYELLDKLLNKLAIEKCLWMLFNLTNAVIRPEYLKKRIFEPRSETQRWHNHPSYDSYLGRAKWWPEKLSTMVASLLNCCSPPLLQDMSIFINPKGICNSLSFKFPLLLAPTQTKHLKFLEKRFALCFKFSFLKAFHVTVSHIPYTVTETWLPCEETRLIACTVTSNCPVVENTCETAWFRVRTGSETLSKIHMKCT